MMRLPALQWDRNDVPSISGLVIQCASHKDDISIRREPRQPRLLGCMHGLCGRDLPTEAKEVGNLPRATLMIRTPGLQWDRNDDPTIPRVSSFSEQVMKTTSALGSRLGRLVQSARSVSGWRVGGSSPSQLLLLTRISFVPNACNLACMGLQLLTIVARLRRSHPRIVKA